MDKDVDGNTTQRVERGQNKQTAGCTESEYIFSFANYHKCLKRKEKRNVLKMNLISRKKKYLFLTIKLSKKFH